MCLEISKVIAASRAIYNSKKMCPFNEQLHALSPSNEALCYIKTQ